MVADNQDLMDPANSTEAPSECAPPDPQRISSLASIENFVYDYPINIIAIASVISSVLIAIVMMKRQYRSTSTGVYMIYLAVVDFLNILMINFTLMIPLRIAPDNTFFKTDSFCRWAFYFSDVAYACSIWTVVLFTVERYIVTYFPMRIKQFCSLKKTYAAITVMTVVISLYAFVAFNHGSYHEEIGCTVNLDDEAQMLVWIGFVIPYIVIPFAILLVLNTLIAVKLRQVTRVRAQLTNAGADGARQKSENWRITIVLQMVSWACILLTLPWFILDLYFKVGDQLSVLVYKDD